MKELMRAVATAKISSAAHPSDASAWAALGKAHLALECQEDALACLRMALALDPSLQLQTELQQAESSEISIRGRGLHISQQRTQLAEASVMQMGTGAVVWEAGLVLAKYLEKIVTSQNMWSNQQRVLELGCGTGISGLAAAMLGMHVVLTDLPDVLPLVNANITANQAAIAAAGGSATALALDWNSDTRGQLDALARGTGKFSYILAADCVYSVGAIPLLVRILCTILSASHDTKVLWCHKRRHKSVDAALRAAWEDAGLECRVVPSAELHPMHHKAQQIDLYQLGWYGRQCK